MRLLGCCALAVVFGAFVCTATAPAANVTYSITANGIKEVTAGGVPNQGDLDATAIGTLLLDNGTGVGTTGFVTLNLSLANLDTASLSAHHIHTGIVTTTGAPLIDLGNPNTLLSGSTLSGTVTGLSAANITTIMGNPTGFYYNLHNAPFPGGAVRDQLGVVIPEPASLGILSLGLAALIRRRR
jgi:hypothetical protein